MSWSFFISGTLGLVTKVALACPPKPTAVNVAFLGLQSYQSVLATFKHARQRLGEILSSCEFLDAGSLQVYLFGELNQMEVYFLRSVIRSETYTNITNLYYLCTKCQANKINLRRAIGN